MRRAVFYFFTSSILFTQSPQHIFADASQEPENSLSPAIAVKQAPFDSFTGKITRNKVRMRVQPSIESPIVKELEKGNLVIVKGESEDFYVVQPSSDMKGYVFRTYILDNIVEGNHVNVRLEPDLESPIIAQLNSGDRVEGNISPLNSKWLEIAPPASTQMYVSKEFIEKIGDASLMAKLEKRRDEVERLLDSTYLISQTEMQNPFTQINLERITDNLNKVINEYSDFPDQIERAKTMLTMVQDAYLQKKIAYLEAKSLASEKWQDKNSQLTAEIQLQQNRLSQLENKLKSGVNNVDSTTPSAPDAQETIVSSPQINHKMQAWIPVESALYQAWTESHPNQSQEQFYEQQAANAQTLRGIIEPYTRVVKNKPGDYLLINPVNRLPIAYLYSTKINLEDKVGKEVTVQGLSRPNNNFAFGAYYILSIE